MEEYITEFNRRLSLIRDQGPGESFHVFMEGLDVEYRRHCYEEGFQTLDHAIRIARAFLLSRSQMVRDAPLHKPMCFERTK